MEHDSDGLPTNHDQGLGPCRGRSHQIPPVWLSRPLIRGIWLGFSLLALVASARWASADPLESSANLDGVYLAVGPVGSAVHTETSWDAAFGGELTLARITERRPIAALALSLGGHRYSERDTGRLWLEGMAATRWLRGTPIGLAGGPTLEVDRVIPARLGAQATLWAYVGVIPYMRVGAVDKSGIFFEMGLRIPLPAFRW
jgi:hypothetical protein